jgi:hypothetical protein
MQAIFMIIQQPKLQNTLTVGLPFTWKLALETSGVPVLSLLNTEQFKAGFSWKLGPIRTFLKYAYNNPVF